MKYVVFTAGTWSRKLLTLDRLLKVDYFVDNDPEKWGKTYVIEEKNNELDKFYIKNLMYQSLSNDALINTNKTIKNPVVLCEEKKDELVILIGDAYHYESISIQLEKMGFIRNFHFFNGWNLGYDFYQRTFDTDCSWIEYEKDNDVSFEVKKWEKRAEIMSSLIPEYTNRLADLGCGDGKLKAYISKNIEYIPIDYCDRKIGNLIVNFNEEKIPEKIGKIDTYYMAGLLCYLYNPFSFLESLFGAKCIIMDVDDGNSFKRLDNRVIINRYIKNTIGIDKIIQFMYEGGFYVTHITKSADEAIICRFERID